MAQKRKAKVYSFLLNKNEVKVTRPKVFAA